MVKPDKKTHPLHWSIYVPSAWALMEPLRFADLSKSFSKQAKRSGSQFIVNH